MTTDWRGEEVNLFAHTPHLHMQEQIIETIMNECLAI